MIEKLLERIEDKLDEMAEKHMSEKERREEKEWEEFLDKVECATLHRRAIENYIKENAK